MIHKVGPGRSRAALCGAFLVKATLENDKVTCSTCLAELEELKSTEKKK